MMNKINHYVKNSNILYFCKTDLEGNYTYISPHFEEAFEFTKQELYGKNSLDTIYVDDHQKTRDIVQKCFENPKTYQSAVLRKPLKNGKLIWTQWEFFLETDEHNNSVEIICYGYDVSRKIKTINLLEDTQKKLETNLIKYQTLFETSSLAIILHTVDGKIYDANNCFCEMVGIEKEKVCEKTMQEFTPAKYWESDRLFLKKLLTDDKDLSYEKEFISTDKIIVPVSVNHRVFHDQNGKIFIWNIVKNITERKKQRETLKRQKELLEQTAHIAKLGGWHVNIETSETYWTTETYKIHDLEYDLSNNLSKALKFYHPDDNNEVLNAVNNIISTGEKLDLEVRLISAKNIQKWVKIIGEAVFVDTKIVAIKGTIQDISDKKKSEETISKHIDLLKDISYTQCHIVRLPIANIIGLTDLLKITSSPIEKEEIYEKIGISVKKLDLIIRDIANKKITD